MTLEKCIQCKSHVSYHSGFVVCAYWKLNQQHVVSRSDDGQTHVVGCSIEENKPGKPS